jgi:uncharacterized membrane protein YeaQ/YmgE (transglycosylase-associated protein family)
MDLVLYLIAVAIGGLIVGALGRLALPGPDPMTLFQTMLVGIGASLLAGVIAYYAFDERAPGLLLSVLCALGIVFAIRKLRERRAAERV